MKNPTIVLTGPTASGKTAMSFALAKAFNAEVIAADSTTIYQGMDIGTDKPSLDPSTKIEDGHYVIRGIKYHLLDRLAPDEEFNAALFRDIAGYEVEKIRERGKIPMFVGGSLLYIDAFVYGYVFPAVEPDKKLRSELEKQSKEELFAQLVSLDPSAGLAVDKNNKRRLIRALEVTIKSGKSFSGQQQKKKLPKNVLYLAINREREQLYSQINQRVDEMFRMGFVAEVRKLLKKYDHNTTMQAAGYRQVINYLEGKIDKAQAIAKTKQAHRNYAKRQLTWLKKNPDVVWVNDESQARQKIAEFLAS